MKWKRFWPANEIFIVRKISTLQIKWSLLDRSLIKLFTVNVIMISFLSLCIVMIMYDFESSSKMPLQRLLLFWRKSCGMILIFRQLKSPIVPVNLCLCRLWKAFCYLFLWLLFLFHRHIRFLQWIASFFVAQLSVFRPKFEAVLKDLCNRNLCYPEDLWEFSWIHPVMMMKLIKIIIIWLSF